MFEGHTEGACTAPSLVVFPLCCFDSSQVTFGTLTRENRYKWEFYRDALCGYVAGLVPTRRMLHDVIILISFSFFFIIIKKNQYKHFVSICFSPGREL